MGDKGGDNHSEVTDFILVGIRVHGGLGETVKPETEDLWHPPLGTAGKASLVTE